MTMLPTVVVILTALALAWMLGSVVLRAGGLLAAAAGVVLVLTGAPAGVAVMAVGAGWWLVGHWLYGLRHHTYRSPLARRIYTQLLPPRLDPTRGWGLPTTSRDRRWPDDAKREARHG